MTASFAPSPPRLLGVTAAILAGGLGTRLRPAVADRPKVLAPVAGRPFVTHLLDFLAAAGLRRVVLLTGFRGEQVRRALGERHGSMALAYCKEPSPLGTGGAMRAALDQLTAETILLLNGDSYCGVDLAAFAACHRRRARRRALALARMDDASRYGRVATAPDGRVTAFAEKGGVRAGLDQRGRVPLGTPSAGGSPIGPTDFTGKGPAAYLDRKRGRLRAPGRRTVPRHRDARSPTPPRTIFWRT